MNKKFIFLVLFVFLLIGNVNAFNWNDNKLLAYYSLDESSGTNFLNSVFPYNNNGTGGFNNIAGASGKLGNGAIFNGTSVGTPASITGNSLIGMSSFVRPTDSFSTNAWVYWTSSGSTYAPIVGASDVNRGNLEKSWYLMINDNGNDEIYGAIYTSSSTFTVSADGSFPLNEWHMVSMTFNGTNMSIYYDGVLNNSVAVTGTVNSGTGIAIASFSDEKHESSSEMFKGKIDEVGIWNRSLLDSEISDLYNDGQGLLYASQFSIHLDTPPENSSRVNGAINFSASISTPSFNLTNKTLNIWNPNGTLLSSNTASLSGNSSTSFSMEGTISVIDDGYLWGFDVCSGDGVGGNCTSSGNRTLNIKKVFELSQSFNNPIIEQSVNSFRFNFSASSSFPISSVILTYNNTNYTGSFSQINSTSYNALSTITAPAISSDITTFFNWTVLFSDGSIFTSSTNNQSIIKLGIDDCSANTIQILNFTLLNEDSQSSINAVSDNSSIKINLNLYPSATSTTPSFEFSQFYNKTLPARVCISDSLGDSSFYMDVLTEYRADGYVNEFYNINNYNLNASSGTSQDIILYDLKSSNSQDFIISYKDSSFLAVSGALIQIRRKYIDEGIFKTVELPKTDVNGEVLAHLVPDDAIYSFIITKNGEVLATFNNVYAICQNPNIEQCRIDFNSFSSEINAINFSTINDFSFSFGLEKSTRTITSTFIVPSGAVANIQLNVTTEDALGTNICSKSITTSAGSLDCVIPSSFGNSTVFAELYKDGSLVASSRIDLSKSPSDIYGASLVFLSLFIIITLIGVGISDNPIFTIILLMVGVILLFTMNFVDSSGLIGSGATILWIIIALILILIKGAKRN